MAGTHTTRAGFLGAGAAAIGGAALAAAWGSDRAPAAPGTITIEGNPFGAAAVTEGLIDPRLDGEFFFFELDKTPSGFVQSPSGGNAEAEVILEKLGTDTIQRKRPGRVKYGDITLKAGVGSNKAVYEWMKAVLDRKPTHRSGTFTAADANFTINGSGTFTNGLISEVTIPALDGGSKEPAYVRMKVEQEATSFFARSGRLPSGRGSTSPPAVTWKFEADGLETSRVNKIEAITIKQKIVEFSDGTSRDYQKEPTSVEIPNLAVWLPADESSKSWLEYFDSFVIKGNNTEDQEKTGSLAFFDAGKGGELARLTFSHLGIFKLTPEKVESGGENIRRIKAEMYCEDITFKFGTADWA